MSKSISGSGSLNLTVQELRLLEIKASVISAINATIDNLLTASNANFTGIVTVNNLTISGSVTVENIVILNTLTAQNIIVNGSSLIETPATVNEGRLRIPFIDVSNNGVTSNSKGVLSSSDKLTFYQNTGTLVVSDYITAPIIAATSYASINPVTSTEDVEYRVSMFGNGNEMTGDVGYTYNCFENRLTLKHLQIDGGLTISGNSVLNTATFTGIVELDLVPNINVNSYTSILLHGDNNQINQDISLSYNSSLNLLQAININSNGTITANTITCDNLTASAELSAQTLAIIGNSVLDTATFTGIVELDLVPNINVNSYTSILLHGDNNEINQDISFSYNSSLNLLQSININANGYVTTTTLTCDTLTISNAPTDNADTASRKIPFIGSNGLLHASSNLYYVPDTQTLVSTNINSSTKISAEDIDVSGDIVFTNGKIFNDPANNYMGLKAINSDGNTSLSGYSYNLALRENGHMFLNASTQIRFYIFNTVSQASVEHMVLTTTSLRVKNDILADANLTCSGSVTIVNPLTSGVNRQCSLMFIDDAGDNRIKVKPSMNFNPSTETLTVPTIVSSELTVNGDATITGTINCSGQVILGSLPLNYIQILSGQTGSFTMTSIVNVNGIWGQNKQIMFSSSASLYDMKVFGQDTKAWQKSTGTTGNFSLISSTYNGMWHWDIVIDCQYNTSNTNARINPKIYLERTRGGISTEKCFGSLANGKGVYWRGGNRSRQVSVFGSGCVDCQVGDIFKIKTLCNLGQNTGFSNNTNLIAEKTYTIEWRYLSNSTSVFNKTF